MIVGHPQWVQVIRPDNGRLARTKPDTWFSGVYFVPVVT
jgi:hypothetical protein